VKYPKGISKGPSGWRISLGPGGSVFRKRFKPETPYSDVESALSKARQKIPAGTEEPTEGFDADVTRYLTDHFTGRAGYAERKRHLGLWVDMLGKETVRSTLTRDDIARTLNQWRANGLAPDTCNKRRTALLALYHALDGKGASNPVREVKKFRPPDPLPRGLAYTLIEKAIKKLPKCKTQARLRVLAYTGMRPGQLMRLTEDDWDVKGRMLTIPGTGKGRGTKPYVIPLSKHGHDALKTFDRMDAWGVFTWAPMARMWKAAAKSAGLPSWATPKDLRHAFGTKLYQVTGDLKAVKELMGHASIKMTERYTLAAVSEQKQKAMKAFEAAGH